MLSGQATYLVLKTIGLEIPMADIVIKVEGDKKQSFLSLLYEMQGIVADTISGVISHYGKDPIESSNWAAIIILKRIIESTKAGAILISHDFDRDAAVLLTNQMELRLDMQYISHDHLQANTWLNHTNSYQKPWKVRMLLEKLFKNKDEFEAEKNVYNRFSMVKHGNPVAETFSFPLAIKNGYLVVPPQEDILMSKLALFIFALFSELFRTFKAAIVDFKRCGFDVNEYENKANFINMMINDLYMGNINEQIHLLEKITPKPELCNSCVVVPENKIEITCLLRRKERAEKFSCEKYKSN